MKLIGSQWISDPEDLADMRREEFWRKVRENKQRTCDHSADDEGVCPACGLQVRTKTLPSANAAATPAALRSDSANNTPSDPCWVAAGEPIL